MKKDLNYIHDLIVRLDSRLDDLAEISVRHDENLKEHMKRSLANEKAVEILAEELKPIQRHVVEVQYLAKLAAVIGSCVIALVTIWQAFK